MSGVLTDAEIRRKVNKLRRAKEPLPDWLKREHARLQREWTRARPAHHIVIRSRARAKKQGVPFHITPSDVEVPERCPICDVEMRVGAGQNNSPSIDRIDNSLPYVAHNVMVICHDCNRRKSDSTPEQMYRIADFVYRRRKKLQQKLLKPDERYHGEREPDRG